MQEVHILRHSKGLNSGENRKMEILFITVLSFTQSTNHTKCFPLYHGREISTGSVRTVNSVRAKTSARSIFRVSHRTIPRT